MKKILLILISFVLIACGKEETPTITLDYNWENIEKESSGSKVNIYMYGGAQNVNIYMDQVVASELKNQNGISLNRVPITDIKDTVNKLIVEKQANLKDGSVDIIWINGENFKELKENDVLWGNFTKSLPNIKYIKDSTMETDFGEEIDGLEVAWGESQFNFIYRGEGEKPFIDSQTLMEYAKANPGKFTYPAIPDYTGSAFVRNIAIDILGYNNIVNMTNEELEDVLEVVWDYFKEIKPYLWRKGETYPEGEGKIDTLYNNGEIDVTMGYTINKVSSKILTGGYPKGSKSFLLDNGTLFNNHYLTIPKNASNKAGALYVANYLLSIESQLSKQDPENWGDFNVLDMEKIPSEEKERFMNMSVAEEIPSFEELATKRVGELQPAKLQIIEKGWKENIGKI